MKKAMVISLVNHKGGVAKTTTSINLAASLAYAGKEVVIIDADPQMNSTIHMLKDLVGKEGVLTISNLLFTPSLDIQDAIQTTAIPNLYMIMADRNLEKMLETNKSRFMKPYDLLNQKIEMLRDEVDFIIIDCPPNLGAAVENALVASTHFITPIDDSAYSELGLIPLEDEMLKKVAQVNAELTCLGVLPVTMKKGTAIDKIIQDKKFFGGMRMPKIEITIPYRQSVINATHTGEIVATPTARTDIAKAYKSLAKFVIDKKEEWLGKNEMAGEIAQ